MIENQRLNLNKILAQARTKITCGTAYNESYIGIWVTCDSTIWKSLPDWNQIFVCRCVLFTAHSFHHYKDCVAKRWAFPIFDRNQIPVTRAQRTIRICARQNRKRNCSLFFFIPTANETIGAFVNCNSITKLACYTIQNTTETRNRTKKQNRCTQLHHVAQPCFSRSNTGAYFHVEKH